MTKFDGDRSGCEEVNRTGVAQDRISVAGVSEGFDLCLLLVTLFKAALSSAQGACVAGQND